MNLFKSSHTDGHDKSSKQKMEEAGIWEDGMADKKKLLEKPRYKD